MLPVVRRCPGKLGAGGQRHSAQMLSFAVISGHVARNPMPEFSWLAQRAAHGGGEGVAQDLVDAVQWFVIASSKLPQGQEAAEIAELRELLVKQMTPAQIAKAERLARNGNRKQNSWLRVSFFS